MNVFNVIAGKNCLRLSNQKECQVPLQMKSSFKISSEHSHLFMILLLSCFNIHLNWEPKKYVYYAQLS